MAIAVREFRWNRAAYGAGHIARYITVAHGPLAGRRSGRWLREVLRPVGHAPRRPDYTFAELVSVHAVAELVESGVASARIAAARERLVSLTGVEQPFSMRGLFTDGERICVQLGSRNRLIDLVNGARVEAADGLAPLPLDGVAFRSGARMVDRPALTWSPLAGVTLDPEAMFGTPCVTGTGIGPWVIEARYRDGETLAELREDYAFVRDPNAVDAALEFQRRMRQLRG